MVALIDDELILVAFTLPLPPPVGTVQIDGRALPDRWSGRRLVTDADRSATWVAAARRVAADPPVRMRKSAKELESGGGTGVASHPGMTAPRQYLPGSTYLVTRRVVRRHYLFRPDEEVNRIYLYCLAVASEQHGVEVHSFRSERTTRCRST